MILFNNCGLERSEHIGNTFSAASDFAVMLLASKLMDKYQKAFEALAEAKSSLDLADFFHDFA